MNLSFDVITKEGDKLVVSLTSFYPYMDELIGNMFSGMELVEISIYRESGNNPIRMEVFGKIAQVLITIAQDNPQTLFYYFCDATERLPHQRAGRNIALHEYRNTLFSKLFKRYQQQAGVHWSDIEIELKSDIEEQVFYAHLLIRDKHLSLVDILRNEVLSNFKTISEQK